MVESDGLRDINELDLILHKCSDEDYEHFYKPSQNNVFKFEEMKTHNTSMCINRVDENGEKLDLRIWGKSEVEPHRRLDLSFKPCTPVVTDDTSVPCNVPDDLPETYENKLFEIKN